MRNIFGILRTFSDGGDTRSRRGAMLVTPGGGTCADGRVQALHVTKGVLILLAQNRQTFAVRGLLNLRLDDVQALRLSWNGVIILRDEAEHVADGLEQDIQPIVALHLPEDIAVLEPSVCENTIQPTEDVGEVSHAGLRTAASLGTQRQPTRKVFRGGEGVGGPVKSMAAVVDGTAGLGRVMHGAKVLPFGSAHLGAGLRRTGRVFSEEGNNEVVDFHRQEPA